jgi:hypothetical protein
MGLGELLIDFHVADFPVYVFLEDIELLLNVRAVEVGSFGGEVITETRDGAWLLNVINIDISSRVEDILHQLRANSVGQVPQLQVNQLGALVKGRVHGSQFVLGNQTIVITERTIGTILDLGRNPSVAYGNTLQVDGVIALGHLLDNIGTECRDVVAAKGFTSNIEIILGKLRVLFQETQHEFPHFCTNFSFVVNIVIIIISVRVPNLIWLINVDKRSIVVPAVGIEGGDALVLIEDVRAIFKDGSQLGRAARTSCHPQDEGISGRFIARLKEPVEEITVMLGISLDVTSVGDFISKLR